MRCIFPGDLMTGCMMTTTTRLSYQLFLGERRKRHSGLRACVIHAGLSWNLEVGTSPGLCHYAACSCPGSAAPVCMGMHFGIWHCSNEILTFRLQAKMHEQWKLKISCRPPMDEVMHQDGYWSATRCQINRKEMANLKSTKDYSNKKNSIKVCCEREQYKCGYLAGKSVWFCDKSDKSTECVIWCGNIQPK